MLCTCAHDWDEHERDVNPEKELPVRRDACAGGSPTGDNKRTLGDGGTFPSNRL